MVQLDAQSAIVAILVVHLVQDAYLLGKLYLYQHQYYSTCPVGTYFEISNCTCQPCALGCSTCYGEGISACTNCENTTASPSVAYYKAFHRDVCTTDCGNFYY